jgi:iron complex transport system permease protein
LPTTKTYTSTFIILFVCLIICWAINISLGSVHIPFTDIVSSLFGNQTSKESWNYIILNYRLPKSFTAILVGSGLSISGLLMQTLFRNPLAGPFVLGISSGASLGVAILILGISLFGGSIAALAYSNFGLALAASIGSFLVLSAVMLVARKLKNTMSILIIGLMFGSLTGAVISVLSYFSNAEQLQQFIFWSFGNLGNLSWQELTLFFAVYCSAILLVVSIIKPLNSLLLGENYAQSLGINLKRTRNFALIATGLLTGVITAFSGPIAFVGLAVPHITKLVFKTSNHKTLLPAVAIIGAMIMLVSDTIAQLPNSEYTLPINAITSIFGAPIVIWLLVRKKNIHY